MDVNIRLAEDEEEQKKKKREIFILTKLMTMQRWM
jgi:hypothetical protein